MVDKKYCMSSYMAFRYVEDENTDFFEGLQHKNFKPLADDKKIAVADAKEMDAQIQKVFDSLQGERLGIMLSGGMDSACLAAYMQGCDAYTFRFLDGAYQTAELNRAE